MREAIQALPNTAMNRTAVKVSLMCFSLAMLNNHGQIFRPTKKSNATAPTAGNTCHNEWTSVDPVPASRGTSAMMGTTVKS